MTFKSLVAGAAGWALKAVGAPAALAATPIGDVKNGVDACIAAISDLRAKKFTFTDAASVLNAIQALLVDAGVEPKVVEEALMIAGALVPYLIQAWQAIGVNPFSPAPRAGPPITEGNWSGIAVDNHADNPSGEIGGPT